MYLYHCLPTFTNFDYFACHHVLFIVLYVVIYSVVVYIVRRQHRTLQRRLRVSTKRRKSLAPRERSREEQVQNVSIFILLAEKHSIWPAKNNNNSYVDRMVSQSRNSPRRCYSRHGSTTPGRFRAAPGKRDPPRFYRRPAWGVT